MIHDAAEFAVFWRAAAIPAPLAIIGGGRWGRVWASVAVKARGSGAGIAIVSREHAEDVHRWRAADTAYRGIAVVERICDAFPRGSGPRIAIIASRPRDHERDGSEALDRGAHVLVEKPLSDRPEGARALMRSASSKRLLLGVGTEFAFLPVLHRCAADLAASGARARRIRLIWNDPQGERRHDAEKRRHEEVSVLTDLMPHAFSIFRVFAPSVSFSVDDAQEDEAGVRGILNLIDPRLTRYALSCDAGADARRRLLDVETGEASLRIDFGGETPLVFRGEKTQPPAPEFAAFDSTLRLELGAFLGQVLGSHGGSAITASLPDLTAMHAAIIAITRRSALA